MAATFFIEDRMRKLTKKRRNNCRELEEFLLQIVMETGRCQSVPPSLVPTQVTCYVTKKHQKRKGTRTCKIDEQSMEH